MGHAAEDQVHTQEYIIDIGQESALMEVNRSIVEATPLQDSDIPVLETFQFKRHGASDIFIL